MKKKFLLKNGVYCLDTTLEIDDCLDFVRITGQNKHGIFSKVLPKRMFYHYLYRCILDPELKLEDLLKQYRSPKYGHYIPYDILELRKRGIMRCGRNIHTEQ